MIDWVMSTSHKPRVRAKNHKDKAPSWSDTDRREDAPGHAPNATRPAFPLASFLWPSRGTTSQWVILPLMLMIIGLFRWATALWPYSGEFSARSSAQLLLIL